MKSNSNELLISVPLSFFIKKNTSEIKGFRGVAKESN